MDLKRVDLFLTLDETREEYSYSFTKDFDDDFDHGIITLSYEGIRVIYQDLAQEFSKFAIALDLTENDLKDLSFLKPFNKLESLILDKNRHIDPNTMPTLKKLQILWVNDCNIVDIGPWLDVIRTRCPQLRCLSLFNNPGARTLINGATEEENAAYRSAVTNRLRRLQYLDEAAVERPPTINHLICPKLFQFQRRGRACAPANDNNKCPCVGRPKWWCKWTS